MTCFKFGTETYRTLDMDAEYGGCHSVTEKFRSFQEKCEDEINEYTTEENKKHVFTVVYGLYGEMYNTYSPSYLAKLSLTGQGSLYSTTLNRVEVPTGIGVYIYHNGKYHNLWIHRHLESNERPVFTNKQALEEILKPFFNTFEIKLGMLKYDSFKMIAWKIKTEKGIFFIPWHSGCVLEEYERFIFEEKPFEELKNTYCVLRFTKYEDDKYKVLNP